MKKIRQEILDELFRKYSTKEEALKNAKFFLTEKLKNIYPSHLEDQHDLNKRVGEAKDRLRQLLREQKEGESLVVVAHSRFLESFSAQRYEEDGTPVNAKWFANCEVASYEL
jgi:broad specificity phosphatase PhoE